MAERWFKHYVESSSSRHLERLAAELGQAPMAVYARWFRLLEEVYREDSGMLEVDGLSADGLARRMWTDADGLSEFLGACAKVGMIDRRCWAEKGIVTSDAIAEQVSAREAKKAPRRPKGMATCPQCGRRFRPANNRSKYCSDACRQAAYRKRAKDGA